MKIEEIEKMDEKHYRKGFDTHLNEQYRRQLQSGDAEFIIGHVVTTKDLDEMAYQLKYRRDDEKGDIYLNTIHASLTSKDFPEGVREHTFTDDSMITAGEMQRMLKYGDKVSVFKSLFNKKNEPYNAWIGINVDGPKNEYGDYPTKSFHDNYFKNQPFIVAEKLKELAVPVKEIEIPGEAEKIERAFKKANLYEATILHNGEEAKGYLSINPGERRIDVLDANLQVIEKQELQKALPAQQQATTAPQSEEDLKKKSQPDQKVNWTKNNQSKGVSR